MKMSHYAAFRLLLAAALFLVAPPYVAAAPSVKWQQLMASEDGVSLALDGSTAVVGAPGENGMRGAAHVFVRSEKKWAKQARLTADEATEYSIFGGAVAVSGDTIVIGAASDGNRGAAYIFVRSGKTWKQQARLMAEDSQPNDNFGVSVAVSKDTAVVGAARQDSAKAQGAAYVFVRSGGTWRQQAKLTAADGYDDSGTFGAEVTADGNTILVERPALNLAHVFFRSGGKWTEQAKAVGGAAALHGDTTLIGHIPAANSSRAAHGIPDELVASSPGGAAYVFKRAGNIWTWQERLVAKDVTAGDKFGALVAVDGKTAVIAATERMEGGRPGAVYVFADAGSGWREQAKLSAAAGMPVIHSLAISSSTVAAVMGKQSSRAESAAYVAALPAAGK